MTDESAVRQAVVETAQELARQGLNRGTSGNVSARVGSAMLVTPSGVLPADLRPGTLARMPLDGSGHWDGPLKPSSEWRFHHDILRARPETGAVIHTHATHCTVFAMLRQPIPAAHYMIAAFGGPDIRCTAYAPYGTQALSDLAVEGLRDRSGVLLGSHGMIVLGRDLREALWRAVELETLAQQVYLARAIGHPVLLDDAEVMRTVERFAGYGQRAQDRPMADAADEG
jgi:L-fuculose-phosphate aldolase